MDDSTISYRAPDTRQIRGVDRDKRTIDVIASTGSIDSHGTRIDQAGWILTQFKKNPVITWAHDDRGFTGSNGLPIARGKNIKVKNNELVMNFEFPDEGKRPFADEVFEMMADGFINAVSVGFEAVESEVMQEKGKDVRVFTKSKLLEVAVVTIPSNDQALVQRAKELNQDPDEMIRRAVHIEELSEGEKTLKETAQIRGVVPKNVSKVLAPVEEPWDKITLSEFTDLPFDDLSDVQKRKIAGHFSWCGSNPPDSFGDCKLPHHRSTDGAVVFRGLASATSRLNQTTIPEADLPAVKRHLRAHYRAFEKDIPDVLRSYDEDDKFEEYYDTKQPTNRASTKVLKKYFEKHGVEQPDNEMEAWKRMLQMIEEKKTLPSTQPPLEAPKVKAEKPSVLQVSPSALQEAKADILLKCEGAALACSRNGMPAKDIESMVRALSDKLIEFHIRSFNP